MYDHDELPNHGRMMASQRGGADTESSRKADAQATTQERNQGINFVHLSKYQLPRRGRFSDDDDNAAPEKKKWLFPEDRLSRASPLAKAWSAPSRD